MARRESDPTRRRWRWPARRRRDRQSSRRRLAVVLIIVGTVSVILLAGVLTVMARSLLDRSGEAQLASVRDGRQAAVERGIEEVQASLAAMAADPGVVRAAADLTQAQASSDQDAIVSAADDAFLREWLDRVKGSDLLVVAPGTGEVVYSAAAGTDGAGPQSWASLETVLDRLPAVPVGDAVIVDGTPPPDGSVGGPVAVAAATIRSGSEVVGALVLAVPGDYVTELVSAGGRWDELGLGDSGDAAVVGNDGLLRSAPRAWGEDPQAYLERLADGGQEGMDVAAAVEDAGTPVLVQEIPDDGISEARGGDESIQTVSGVLGGRVRAAVAPVEAGSLGWVVVATQSATDSVATLLAFMRWVVLLLAVLVPLIMVAAVLLSRALTRPIPALVAVSSELADGNLDVAVPDLGRNEFGDLARQLGAVADELQHQRAAVAGEEERIQRILGAVVPARLMDRVRQGERGFSDVLETATVVSVTLVGLPDPSGADHDAVLEATAQVMRDLEDLAVQHGVEPVRAAARQESFLAGLGAPDPDVPAAAAFAIRVPGTVREAGREFGVDIGATVGMAAGTIGTGLLGTTQVAFGVWGDPPGRAAALDGLARAGEILVDESVADALGGEWSVTPVDDLVDLGDGEVDAFALAIPDELARGDTTDPAGATVLNQQ